MKDLLTPWPELAALRDRLLVTDESARNFGRENLELLILAIRPYAKIPPDRLVVTTAAAALVGVYLEDFQDWARDHSVSAARNSKRGLDYWRAGDIYTAMSGGRESNTTLADIAEIGAYRRGQPTGAGPA